jgi:hypothetical protein
MQLVLCPTAPAISFGTWVEVLLCAQGACWETCNDVNDDDETDNVHFTIIIIIARLPAGSLNTKQ